MKTIKSTEEFEKLVKEKKDFIIYKHSSTCSLSALAKREVEKFQQENQSEDYPIYEVLVLESRPVSNYIAEKSNTTHQSPQILLFKDGVCRKNFSHKSVNVGEIKQAVRLT